MTHRVIPSMTGFKVVRRADPFYMTSARIYGSLSLRNENNGHIDMHLFYHPLEWVSANPIFAQQGLHPVFFRHLRLAKNFLCAAFDEIWAIETEEAFLPEVQSVIASNDLAMFITSISCGLSFQPRRAPWPAGTWMAKRIKLVERVL